jgi:hypothetical protein
MKAAVYTKTSSGKVLEIREVAQPVPKDNQVLIRVRAASINPMDWRLKSKRPGVDVAGEVIALGRTVTQFKTRRCSVWSGQRRLCRIRVRFPTARAEVMSWWEEGWTCVFEAIDPLSPEDVMRTVTIRGEPHTVLQAINRQIAHYAQHIGQIVFLAKHLRSSQWKTLSIPRGKSEEYKKVHPKTYKPAS